MANSKELNFGVEFFMGTTKVRVYYCATADEAWSIYCKKIHLFTGGRTMDYANNNEMYANIR